MAEKPRPASDTQPNPAIAANAGVPQEAAGSTTENTPEEKLNPTRFGDWERNGRCIDF